MKQTFTKNNAKNTNSSGRAILRQGTLRCPNAVPPTSRTFAGFAISTVRRVLAFVVLAALCSVSCRNLIEAPEETAEIAESGGGTEAAGRLYALSGAVGAGGAVPSSLAANSRSAAFGDTGGGIENGVYGDADGTAIQSGRAAAANARSATYSSGQLTGVSYTVTATTVRSPDSDKNPPGTEKTVDATAADDGFHRFYIELLEGTYTLSVEGFLGEGDGKKKILEGTYRNADTDNKVVIGPESSPDDCNILVHPIFDGDGTGTVSLTLSMAADCNIKCLKAVWEVQADDGTKTPKTQTFKNNDGSNLTSATFTMTADGEASSGIQAGFHRVDFYFYGDEGGTDELYSCTQYLNVFENLTTDLWRNNGATPYIDDDGNFTLTRSVIYSRKLFYVQNRNDSEKGEGTRYSPFDSVQTAVQKILAANDGASEYKIALLSDDDDKSTASYSPDTNSSYICINPDKPLKLIIESDISESRDTNGGNPFTIDAARTADKTGRVMYIGQNAEVTLNNIKITGGYSEEQGGGIHSIGTLIFSGVTVSGCHATYGGGLYNSKGTLTITGGAITGCTATESGGGIYNSDGTFTIESGTVSGNTAEKNGGGVGSYGTFTMKGGIISGNTAKCANSFGGGGGLYIYGGRCSLEGGTISGNRAEDKTDRNGGGGVYIYSGTFTVSGGTIGGSTDGDKNEAKRGGGIYNNTSTFTMTGGSVIGNKGTMGGGIYIYSSFNFEGGIIGGNTASSGGGVYVYRGTFTMEGGTISENAAGSEGKGGGVYVINGSFTMKGGTISGNEAKNGGGVYNSSTFTMESGTISGNEAKSFGGGVYNAGSFTMTGGTVSGNEATSSGGGVFVSTSGIFTMESGAVSGNTTTSNGGGVYIDGSTFTMNGGEISGNTATDRGGGVMSNGTFTMGGSASVPAGDDGKNDVYLASGKTIGIASALTATTPVAMITPYAYTAGRQVLSAADGSTATLAANYEKFAVTAESDGTEWLVAADGTLKSSVPEGFVRVKGGTVVGKANTDNYDGVFIAGRTVTLSPYMMCDHEVTQGEWEKALSSSQNTSGVTASPSLCVAGSADYTVNFGSEQKNRPVENVTWYDAVYYCNIRSEQEGLTKAYDISGITQSGGHITAATVSLVSDADGYRLPTEAEWEYAARGGDPNAAAWDYTFSGAATASGVAYTSSGNSGMDSVGWYSWNNKDGTTGAASVTGDASGKGTHEVKQKAANALDIYDMSGNVYEWCWDWYGTVASDTPATGLASGSYRVARGGAWFSYAGSCSVSYRNYYSPYYRISNVGFRVVRSVSQ